jgi:hypothetical protein
LKKDYFLLLATQLYIDAVNCDYLAEEHARPGNQEYHKGTIIDALKPEHNEKVYNNLVAHIKDTVSQLS